MMSSSSASSPSTTMEGRAKRGGHYPSTAHSHTTLHFTSEKPDTKKQESTPNHLHLHDSDDDLTNENKMKMSPSSSVNTSTSGTSCKVLSYKAVAARAVSARMSGSTISDDEEKSHPLHGQQRDGGEGKTNEGKMEMEEKNNAGDHKMKNGKTFHPQGDTGRHHKGGGATNTKTVQIGRGMNATSTLATRGGNGEKTNGKVEGGRGGGGGTCLKGLENDSISGSEMSSSFLKEEDLPPLGVLRDQTSLGTVTGGSGGDLLLDRRRSNSSTTMNHNTSSLALKAGGSGGGVGGKRGKQLYKSQILLSMVATVELPIFHSEVEKEEHVAIMLRLGSRRRRCPVDPVTCRLLFWGVRCKHAVGTCPEGEKCRCCHTETELYFHPAVYKATLCSNKAGKGGTCCFSSFSASSFSSSNGSSSLSQNRTTLCGRTNCCCWKAHSKSDLRVEHARKYALPPGPNKLSSNETLLLGASLAGGGNGEISSTPPMSNLCGYNKALVDMIDDRQRDLGMNTKTSLSSSKGSSSTTDHLHENSHTLKKNETYGSALLHGRNLEDDDNKKKRTKSIEEGDEDEEEDLKGGVVLTRPSSCDRNLPRSCPPGSSSSSSMLSSRNVQRKDSSRGKGIEGISNHLADDKNHITTPFSEGTTSATGDGPSMSSVSSAGGESETNAAGGGGGGGGGVLNFLLPDGSLDLTVFKVFPCRNKNLLHERKSCPYYHNYRDKRRAPVTYRAEQCEEHFDLDTATVQCSKGDNCERCHNRHELLYHPNIYKQRFCSNFPNNGRNVCCARGIFCAFAHTRGEIRATLFTEEEEKKPDCTFFVSKFKTVWCPYGSQHDWHTCGYAHTYQDCRRSPAIGYGSEPCPAWNKDLHSADYDKRCPHGARCSFSHGSKEQLYHPSYYKTMPCIDYRPQSGGGASGGVDTKGGGSSANHSKGPHSQRNGGGLVLTAIGGCPRGFLCAFYHDVSERRLPSPPPLPQFSYTQPLPVGQLKFLQPLFLQPPLFNLDDFEAFGHQSRLSGNTGRRGVNGVNFGHNQNRHHHNEGAGGGNGGGGASSFFTSSSSPYANSFPSSLKLLPQSHNNTNSNSNKLGYNNSNNTPHHHSNRPALPAPPPPLPSHNPPHSNGIGGGSNSSSNPSTFSSSRGMTTCNGVIINSSSPSSSCYNQIPPPNQPSSSPQPHPPHLNGPPREEGRGPRRLSFSSSPASLVMNETMTAMSPHHYATNQKNMPQQPQYHHSHSVGNDNPLPPIPPPVMANGHESNMMNQKDRDGLLHLHDKNKKSMRDTVVGTSPGYGLRNSSACLEEAGEVEERCMMMTGGGGMNREGDGGRLLPLNKKSHRRREDAAGQSDEEIEQVCLEMIRSTGLGGGGEGHHGARGRIEDNRLMMRMMKKNKDEEDSNAFHSSSEDCYPPPHHGEEGGGGGFSSSPLSLRESHEMVTGREKRGEETTRLSLHANVFTPKSALLLAHPQNPKGEEMCRVDERRRDYFHSSSLSLNQEETHQQRLLQSSSYRSSYPSSPETYHEEGVRSTSATMMSMMVPPPPPPPQNLEEEREEERVFIEDLTTEMNVKHGKNATAAAAVDQVPLLHQVAAMLLQRRNTSSSSSSEDFSIEELKMKMDMMNSHDDSRSAAVVVDSGIPHKKNTEKSLLHEEDDGLLLESTFSREAPFELKGRAGGLSSVSCSSSGDFENDIFLHASRLLHQEALTGLREGDSSSSVMIDVREGYSLQEERTRIERRGLLHDENDKKIQDHHRTIPPPPPSAQDAHGSYHSYKRQEGKRVTEVVADRREQEDGERGRERYNENLSIAEQEPKTTPSSFLPFFPSAGEGKTKSGRYHLSGGEDTAGESTHQVLSDERYSCPQTSREHSSAFSSSSLTVATPALGLHEDSSSSSTRGSSRNSDAASHDPLGGGGVGGGEEGANLSSSSSSSSNPVMGDLSHSDKNRSTRGEGAKVEEEQEEATRCHRYTIPSQRKFLGLFEQGDGVWTPFLAEGEEKKKMAETSKRTFPLPLSSSPPPGLGDDLLMMKSQKHRQLGEKIRSSHEEYLSLHHDMRSMTGQEEDQEKINNMAQDISPSMFKSSRFCGSTTMVTEQGRREEEDSQRERERWNSSWSSYRQDDIISSSLYTPSSSSAAFSASHPPLFGSSHGREERSFSVDYSSYEPCYHKDKTLIDRSASPLCYYTGVSSGGATREEDIFHLPREERTENQERGGMTRMMTSGLMMKIRGMDNFNHPHNSLVQEEGEVQPNSHTGLSQIDYAYFASSAPPGLGCFKSSSSSSSSFLSSPDHTGGLTTASPQVADSKRLYSSYQGDDISVFYHSKEREEEEEKKMLKMNEHHEGSDHLAAGVSLSSLEKLQEQETAVTAAATAALALFDDEEEEENKRGVNSGDQDGENLDNQKKAEKSSTTLVPSCRSQKEAYLAKAIESLTLSCDRGDEDDRNWKNATSKRMIGMRKKMSDLVGETPLSSSRWSLSHPCKPTLSTGYLSSSIDPSASSTSTTTSQLICTKTIRPPPRSSSLTLSSTAYLPSSWETGEERRLGEERGRGARGRDIVLGGLSTEEEPLLFHQRSSCQVETWRERDGENDEGDEHQKICRIEGKKSSFTRHSYHQSLFKKMILTDEMRESRRKTVIFSILSTCLEEQQVLLDRLLHVGLWRKVVLVFLVEERQVEEEEEEEEEIFQDQEKENKTNNHTEEEKDKKRVKKEEDDDRWRAFIDEGKRLYDGYDVTLCDGIEEEEEIKMRGFWSEQDDEGEMNENTNNTSYSPKLLILREKERKGGRASSILECLYTSFHQYQTQQKSTEGDHGSLPSDPIAVFCLHPSPTSLLNNHTFSPSPIVRSYLYSPRHRMALLPSKTKSPRVASPSISLDAQINGTEGGMMKFFSSFPSPSSSSPSLSFLKNTQEGKGGFPPLVLPGLTAIGSDSASLLTSSEEEEKARKEEGRKDAGQEGRSRFSSLASSLQWSEECPFFTIHLVLASSPSSFLQAYYDEDDEKKQQKMKTPRMSSPRSRHQDKTLETSVDNSRFHRVGEDNDEEGVYLCETGSLRGAVEEKKTKVVFVSSSHLPLWSSMFERSYRLSLPPFYHNETAEHDFHKKATVSNTDPSLSLSILPHEEMKEKKGKLVAEGVLTPPSNTHTCTNSLEDLTIAGTGGAGQGSPASSISSLPPAMILSDDDSSSPSSSPSYQRHTPAYGLSIPTATTTPSLPSIPPSSASSASASASASSSSLGSSSLMMIGFPQKSNKGSLVQNSEYGGGIGKCCYLSNTSSACKWRRRSLSSTTIDDDRGVSLDTACTSSEQPTLSTSPGTAPAAHFMNTHSHPLQLQSIDCGCSSSSSSSSSSSPSLYGADVETSSSSPLKMIERLALGIELGEGQPEEGRGEEEVGHQQEDRSPSTVDFTTPRSSPPSSPLFNYTTTSPSSAKHLGDHLSTNQLFTECTSSSSSSSGSVMERRNLSTPSSIPEAAMTTHSRDDNPLFSLHLSDEEEKERKEGEQGSGRKSHEEDDEELNQDQMNRSDRNVEEEQHVEVLSEDTRLFKNDLLLTSLLQDELKRFLDISFSHSVKDSLGQRRTKEEEKRKVYQSSSTKEEALSYTASMTPTPVYFVCWVPPTSFYHHPSSYQHLEKKKEERQAAKDRNVHGEHRSSPCCLFASEKDFSSSSLQVHPQKSEGEKGSIVNSMSHRLSSLMALLQQSKNDKSSSSSSSSSASSSGLPLKHLFVNSYTSSQARGVFTRAAETRQGGDSSFLSRLLYEERRESRKDEKARGRQPLFLDHVEARVPMISSRDTKEVEDEEEVHQMIAREREHGGEGLIFRMSVSDLVLGCLYLDKKRMIEIRTHLLIPLFSSFFSPHKKTSSASLSSLEREKIVVMTVPVKAVKMIFSSERGDNKRDRTCQQTEKEEEDEKTAEKQPEEKDGEKTCEGHLDVYRFLWCAWCGKRATGIREGGLSHDSYNGERGGDMCCFVRCTYTSSSLPHPQERSEEEVQSAFLSHRQLDCPHFYHSSCIEMMMVKIPEFSSRLHERQGNERGRTTSSFMRCPCTSFIPRLPLSLESLPPLASLVDEKGQHPTAGLIEEESEEEEKNKKEDMKMMFEHAEKGRKDIESDHERIDRIRLPGTMSGSDDVSSSCSSSSSVKATSPSEEEEQQEKQDAEKNEKEQHEGESLSLISLSFLRLAGDALNHTSCDDEDEEDVASQEIEEENSKTPHLRRKGGVKKQGLLFPSHLNLSSSHIHSDGDCRVFSSIEDGAPSTTPETSHGRKSRGGRCPSTTAEGETECMKKNSNMRGECCERGGEEEEHKRLTSDDQRQKRTKQLMMRGSGSFEDKIGGEMLSEKKKKEVNLWNKKLPRKFPAFLKALLTSLLDLQGLSATRHLQGRRRRREREARSTCGLPSESSHMSPPGREQEKEKDGQQEKKSKISSFSSILSPRDLSLMLFSSSSSTMMSFPSTGTPPYTPSSSPQFLSLRQLLFTPSSSLSSCTSFFLDSHLQVVPNLFHPSISLMEKALLAGPATPDSLPSFRHTALSLIFFLLLRGNTRHAKNTNDEEIMLSSSSLVSPSSSSSFSIFCRSLRNEISSQIPPLLSNLLSFLLGDLSCFTLHGDTRTREMMRRTSSPPTSEEDTKVFSRGRDLMVGGEEEQEILRERKRDEEENEGEGKKVKIMNPHDKTSVYSLMKLNRYFVASLHHPFLWTLQEKLNFLERYLQYIHLLEAELLYPFVNLSSSSSCSLSTSQRTCRASPSSEDDRYALRGHHEQLLCLQEKRQDLQWYLLEDDLRLGIEAEREEEERDIIRDLGAWDKIMNRDLVQTIVMLGEGRATLSSMKDGTTGERDQSVFTPGLKGLLQCIQCLRKHASILALKLLPLSAVYTLVIEHLDVSDVQDDEEEMSLRFLLYEHFDEVVLGEFEKVNSRLFLLLFLKALSSSVQTPEAAAIFRLPKDLIELLASVTEKDVHNYYCQQP
ncbi:zinc finger (ccch type) motif-containing protein [Cystoisospora suis]|uniref:Zinc finger (Ccch type) motif-containing protein n=1 Tax=Cystoisospora suis TaxID=483139 RepID=A0A2C6LFW7_9APIC|nr:zinc finger (ccch type) motif-containing protein [Cystoisospora suis]